MCGILLAKSSHTYEHHLNAFTKLNRRGPDFSIHQYKNNIFIGQTVLHITGNDNYYRSTNQRQNFLAYNGEIYNYRRLGHYSNDIELIDQLVPNRFTQFKQLEGMWAWAWTDFDHIWYATDPQGEKCLYRYQDTDTLIVCSEIAPILEYKKFSIKIDSYTTKHWPVITQTPWIGIERVPPGYAYNFNNDRIKLDSVFDWQQSTTYNTIDQASEEFEHVFARVIKDMTPDEPYGLGYSAGIDTSCILSMMPDVDHLYTLNNINKDIISLRVKDFLTNKQQDRLINIDIDEQQWGEFLKQTISSTCMPAQSWSFVGQWIIASQCQERILFSGIGADELFGGYDVYQTLPYQAEHSNSPYSYFENDQEMQALWKQCLNFYNDPEPATLLMDFLIQIGAVDMRGVDICTQAFGVEPRSPFTHPAIIKFALNLPYEYRIGKPLLKRLFLKYWNKDLLLPKQGFTGHCNDSYPYLGIDIPRDNNRHKDWKNILHNLFLSIHRPID